MDFIDEAKSRGFVAQITDEQGLRSRMASGPVHGYIGFDATADSLHVGSLVQIMMLRLLKKHGHRPHVLLGGATTRIGDPSFRDSVRPVLTEKEINHNLDSIQKVFEQFFDWRDVKNFPTMHDNHYWFRRINYLEFLRDTASLFSVNRLLSFDSVKTRLEREQGLSVLEFNYAMMQAYDFWYLNKYNGVCLQMGGSDQWGNIVSGIDYIHRREQKTVFGLTAPLIVMSDGKKMGKSENGAVWLSKSKFSAYDYWQFWRNVPDADVGRFLRLFTELPLDEIERLEQHTGAGLNAAKIILANEATEIAHGIVEAQKARQTAHDVFYSKNKMSEDLKSFCFSDLEQGVSLVSILNVTGLAESKNSAKRLIEGKGIRFNDVVIDDVTAIINESGKLSVGKKNHVLIKGK